MAGRIATRLKERGIVLPPPFPPGGSYVGKLGRDLDIATGQKAARQTALQILAEVQHGVPGGLDRVTRAVKLFALGNCRPDFTQQAQVINGASDLMAEVFGEAGKHARVAIGAETLPFGIAVEIDGIFEIG